MELKVSVDGIQRVVCGVTGKTTCQEVVIALAQALGRTGRYTLKEKYKEYERNVTPGERLLESLGKYGQQTREVQLTLQHKGPLLEVDSLLPGATLRKVEGSIRGRTAGSSKALHRQSLPPLSCLRLHTDPLQGAQTKRPKRKSFTFVEEARGWLGSLGRSTRQEKGKAADSEKTETPCPSNSEPHGLKVSQETACCKTPMVTAVQKRASFLCDPSTREELDQNENAKIRQMDSEFGLEHNFGSSGRANDALHKLLSHQQACLLKLQGQISFIDVQIHKLEKEHCVGHSLHIWQSIVEDEEEQFKYWENKLRAEEAYEQDLQEQFLEMKQKAAECKARLEEYKLHLQGLCEYNISMCTLQCRCSRAEVEDPPQNGTGTVRATVTATADPSAAVKQAFTNHMLQSGSSEDNQLRQRWARTPVLHQSEAILHFSSTMV